MATQTQTVSIDEATEPTLNESQVNDESQQKEQNGLRRRFKKNGGKSRKPPGNKWLQQQIPACRPVFTATSVSIGFSVVGIIFVILGSIFTATTVRLREYQASYTSGDDTNCKPCEDYLASIANFTNQERANISDCHCHVNITIDEPLRPPWNIYYGMRNYYQNHRRYLNSLDIDQLQGKNLMGTPSSDCRPFIDETVDDSQQPYVPCGLIANSWFNDSFLSFKSVERPNLNITFNRNNIAWNTDRTIRFQNPDRTPNITTDQITGTLQPPNWPMTIADVPGGLTNESLIVWFRISAFPVFRKLYGRAEINGSEAGRAELPAGNYTINIVYNYPVSAFNGGKSIILSEVSWLGGRNLFLGITYLITGCILIVSAVVLLIVHLFFSRWKVSDRSFLHRSW